MKTLRLFLSLVIPLWAGYAIWQNWDQIAGYALVAGLITGVILVAVAVLKTLRVHRADEPKAALARTPPRPLTRPEPQPNSQWYGPQPSIPGGLVPSQQPRAQWIDLPSNQYETEV